MQDNQPTEVETLARNMTDGLLQKLGKHVQGVFYDELYSYILSGLHAATCLPVPEPKEFK